jgi:hypothetical protein
MPQAHNTIGHSLNLCFGVERCEEIFLTQPKNLPGVKPET